MSTMVSQMLNGVDAEFLRQSIETIAADPSMGKTHWSVATHWKGGTRSDSHVEGYRIGGQYVEKDFTVHIDEPLELGGTNQFANPQEYLLSALNACMMVGYVAVCALEGIELQELRIETRGEIDLRGFLGIDPNVKPGYDELQYTVHIKGDATPEQFRKVHEFVTATSPNRFNVATAIPLNARLMVE